jgi:hypothetical protein
MSYRPFFGIASTGSNLRMSLIALKVYWSLLLPSEV